ncbi:MAG: DUF58 domain-containing protein [Paracoccaceae bacterium]
MNHAPDDRRAVSARAALLRRDAERIGGTLPPLLAEAERLAATVQMGLHGRRKSGPGETFWQYRRAMPGDTLSDIDWRRSARSDNLYVREMEWDAAQTVSIWADDARAMDYRGSAAVRTKRERAELLALALAVLLIRAGERVALLGTEASVARPGESQLRRMAFELARERADRPEYGAPPSQPPSRGGRAVFLSDFLGDSGATSAALERAARLAVSGCAVQVLDETEETFPFDGRVLFESMGGTIRFETERARALREAYQGRLADSRGALMKAVQMSGWRCLVHHTSESPRKALLWLYIALGGLA